MMPYHPIDAMPAQISALTDGLLLQLLSAEVRTWQDRDVHGAAVAEALYRGLLR